MLNEAVIKALEEKGFNRWTKGGLDRLYINAAQLGLECTYYKTGNISSAYFNGERISNSMGYSYKAAKTYIDINSGRLFSSIPALEVAAMALYDEAIA